MTDNKNINSDAYWDTRFVEDWESCDGPAQSRFFARIAIEQLPKWLMDQLRNESLTLADWGCAQGDGTQVLADHLGARDVTGIDFSHVAVEQATRRYPGLRFVTENWMDENSDGHDVFDVVFSSNTLEHFHNPYDVLDRLCAHAKNAVVLALPYREVKRIDEHFFSFSPENIPAFLPNGFRLTWARVVDCRTIAHSLWAGEQIILLYTDSKWIDGLGLKLINLAIEHDPATPMPENVKRILDEWETAVTERNASRAVSELAKTERNSAVADRDVALALLLKIQNTRSWRVTRPLRFLARIVRHGLIMEDRRKLVQRLRRAYFQLPLPSSVREAVRLVYRRTRDGFTRSVQSVQAAHRFQAPSVRPAMRAPGKPDYIVWGVIDWHFRHQRPQHLAEALAASGRRVFYVSANLHSEATPGFTLEQLDSAGRLFQVQLHLAGAPSIYGAGPVSAELSQLRASVGELLGWADVSPIVSLVQHPYWHGVAGVLPYSRLVYDCMDHHEGFGNNTQEILVLEKALLRDADLTVATSAWLEQLVSPQTRRCTVIRNAGEFARFAARPDRVFRDQAGRKVLGYTGAIAEWFDQALVEAMALRFPDCLILLVGADSVNARARLKRYSNIQFIGEVPYGELTYYVHGFDVCLLPFKVIPLTLATNPVKVYEYLGAGRPVVAVDLPEMRQFDGLVQVGATHAAFLDGIAHCLGQPLTPEAIEQRQAFAREQTWVHRAHDLIAQAEEPVDMPLASVIVVTYNNLELTKICLDSLLRYSDYPEMEIIVVDNASSDGSPDYLREWAASGSNRQVILNADNRGFAAANNQGLTVARGEYLVLLNNDTHVTPGWLGSLIGHLRRDPSIGLLGPVTNNIGNEAKIEIRYSTMDEMLERSAAFTRRHIGVNFDLRTAAFFCVMLPRAVYEKVGHLDEVFGRGFFEDDDYCRRVEQCGLRIACAEDVFVHHHLSASFGKLKSADRLALFEQNKATYESKWGKWEPHAYTRKEGNMAAVAEVPRQFMGQRHIYGNCNICGHRARFFYTDPSLWRESLNCECCMATSRYRSIARGILLAIKSLTGIDAYSLAALPRDQQAHRLRIYDTQPPFYYLPCAYPLPDLLKATGWIDVELSQFKPKRPMGEVLAKGVTNQNLECLTFGDGSLDIVITSDVMEHVRLDDRAHNEIYRVLKPGGIYLFTVPHNRVWDKNLVRIQVVDPADAGKDVHLLEPEYHGDTNSDEGGGVIAYRTYGKELELYLSELGFHVNYYRDDIPMLGILNTELYLCTK